MSARRMTGPVGALRQRVAGAALVALASMVPGSAQAQAEYDVRGTIADSAGAGVEGAMVVALALPDSLLTEFATTNGEGAFLIRGLRPGEYLLQVTLIGHQTVRNPFAITDTDFEAGTIELAVRAVDMEPLVVTLEHVPFLNMRDTLGYNALAFETRPNATVEDLLERLPGIEVDRDGTITAQGEEVQNVLVDGKEFFGSDPTIATRNLPADAVETVKVFDKRSDMAEFTGIEDGEEERTIDLELREEARQGYFGRMSGALGADLGDTGPLALPGGLETPPELSDAGRDQVPYDGRFSLNRFSPTTQLAALGNLNNINQAGFSWGDYQNFMGGAQGLGGGRDGGQIGGGRDDGFTETIALGLNASRDFGGDSWVRTSYFLSSLDNLQNRMTRQQQLLGSDVASLSDELENEQTDNLTHRLNLNAQVRFSEGHDLRLRGNFNAGSSSLAANEVRDTRTADGGLLNAATTDYGVDGDDLGGSARLTWRKRLNDEGRSIVAEARANLSDSDLLGNLSSRIESDPGDPRFTTQDILQEQTEFGRTLGHSLRLSVTEPLAEGTVVELFGERSATDEDRDKSIFDIGTGTPILNDALSSGFERVYTYLRGGFRFNRSGDKARLMLGVQVQSSDLDGTILDRNETIANGYTHLLPSADFRYEIDEGRHLRVRYSTSTREPSMSQLQPFADNSNPIRLYVGNPDLQPEYRHRLNTDYRFFDQFSFLNLFTYANLTYTSNNITQARNVDEQGIQTLSPVNTGSEWSANVGGHFGTPIRPLGVQVNLNYNLNYTTGTELLNGVANDSRIIQNTVGFGIENRRKDLFDIEAGAKLTFNNVSYSLNEELNQGYLNSTIFGEGSLYLGAWTLGTQLDWNLYDQDLFGPGQNVALWEASLSRFIMSERAEIEIVAFDLLNQNQGVSFNNSASSIQERRIQSLGQFVMLRLTWHLGSRSGGRAGMGGRGDRMPHK